ncbi:DUF484 family protein [Paraburkholderia hayleyella]|uniref:DUF484 family protein n=1 Tax=Paraburkholderia hayleyella TaxID=2152889 RepID=UPI001290AD1C|nr:DUF484 family protein [Paraburkholderia hayleyella]
MNDREIAAYLLATPDFFVEHAEVLAAVRLANPHGKAAVSLQERQIEILREKNKMLERRLAELLRYGHENDSMATHFCHWTARVAAERDPHALPQVIAAGLREVFEVPQAALRVWGVAEPYRQADFTRQAGEEMRLFANSLVVPYCGANSGFEAAQWLLPSATAAAASLEGEASAAAAAAAAGTASVPDDSEKTESIVLLALRDPQAGADAPAFGLLVMGSPDPRRFHAGMATDFLTQIGTLASAALSRLLPR